MATEHTAFSASGESTIVQGLDVKPDTTADNLAPGGFEEYYEIERTANEIIKGDYKRVGLPSICHSNLPPIHTSQIALQFPDELLHDSVPIYRRLRGRIGLGRELYVLADTSYGRQAGFPALCARYQVDL